MSCLRRSQDCETELAFRGDVGIVGDRSPVWMPSGGTVDAMRCDAVPAPRRVARLVRFLVY